MMNISASLTGTAVLDLPACWCIPGYTVGHTENCWPAPLVRGTVCSTVPTPLPLNGEVSAQHMLSRSTVRCLRIVAGLLPLNSEVSAHRGRLMLNGEVSAHRGRL